MEKTVAEEIAEVSMERPHVVLLGPGASRAAFPHGERFGRLLPVMADILNVMSVDQILSTAGIHTEGGNFEDIYSKLANAGRE